MLSRLQADWPQSGITKAFVVYDMEIGGYFPSKTEKKIFFFSFLPLKCTQIEQRGPNTFQHLFPCFIKAGKLGVGSSTLMFSTVVMKHIKK